MKDKGTVETFVKLHSAKLSLIRKRLDAFSQRWRNGNEVEIFAELVFCLLTPQSKAVSCWVSVEKLLSNNLLLKGNAAEIARTLKGVRFHNKKADYIIQARKMFTVKGKISIRNKIKQLSSKEARDWLVQNVKGMGYKEASHFLRNMGLGEDLAILDRHILFSLRFAGVIENIPGYLSRKTYIDIENRMKKFARRIEIPISHLDFVMWYKETGKIFK